MDDFRKLTDTEQYVYRQSEMALGHLRRAIGQLEAQGQQETLSLLKDARLCLVDLVGELDLQAYKRSEAPRGRRASDAPRDFATPAIKDQLILEAYRALAALKDAQHPVADSLETVLARATEGD